MRPRTGPPGYLPMIPQEKAECDPRKLANRPVSMSADDFFDPRRQVAAKIVCEGCDVRALCFLHGLAGNEEGVWGGVWFSTFHRLKSVDPNRKLRRAEAISWLAERMGMTVQEFTQKYGIREEGIKRALKAYERGATRKADAS